MQLREALTTITGHSKESLLISSAKGGNKEIFNVVVKLLDGAVRISLSSSVSSTRHKMSGCT